MYFKHIAPLLLLCFAKENLVSSYCENSFVVICDSVSDVQHNSERNSLNEVIVQPSNLHDTPEFNLTSQQLYGLSNLKWLIINQHLRTINPNSFIYCKNLQLLILYGNNLSVINKSTFNHFKNLLKLGLANNNIEQLQERSFVRSKIETLDLSHNKIQALKSGVFKDCQIQTLSAIHNKLYLIDTGCLPRSLKVLHLDHNAFTVIPQEITNLGSLQEFTISHNKLTAFPDLSPLESLSRLDLSFNSIASVSGELDDLKKLQFLNLNKNKLKQFIFTAPFLNVINKRFFLLLSFNHLRNLNLENVRSSEELVLSLSGNPWGCACFEEMERTMRRNNISRTVCDQKILDAGLNPYCVFDEQGSCAQNWISSSALDKYGQAYETMVCDIFNDISSSHA